MKALLIIAALYPAGPSKSVWKESSREQYPSLEDCVIRVHKFTDAIKTEQSGKLRISCQIEVPNE